MGRVRRRAVAVSLLSGLLGLPAVPPAAADTGHVAYVLDSQVHGSETYDAAAGDTVTARYVPESRGLHVAGSRSGSARSFSMWPNDTTTIATGTYTVGSGVWMGVSACSYVTAGTIAITELVKDGTGALTRLALSYDSTCNSGRRVTGAVRYHSDAAWAGVRMAQAGRTGALPGRTEDRTVTVTATGPTPVTLGAATVAATSGGDAFTVTGDECAGLTLATGESCVVTLSFAPAELGHYAALLSVVADTARGAVLLPLDGRGVQPPAAPADVRAVAGDDGISVSWNPPAADWRVPAITGYRVFRDGAAEPFATVETPYYADPAAPGESHTYAVSAVAGDAGEGPVSSASAATVPQATTEGTGDVTGVAWWSPGGDSATAAPGLTATPGTLRFTVDGRDVVVRPVSGAAWAPGTVHADLRVVDVCAAPAVPLTVPEARVHADGTPVTLAFTGRIPCGGTPIDVEVRYAATTPLLAADTRPDSLVFLETAPGLASGAVTVTIANDGSAPLELGTPAVPAHWTVSANTCAVVAPGAACTFDVAFTPAAAGDHAGVVVIGDNTARGRRTVRVRGESRAAPGAVRDFRATALLGRVVLTYDPPAGAYPTPVLYSILRATSPTGPWTQIKPSRSDLPDPADLTPTAAGQRVYYRVQAYNDEGSGPYSYTDVVTTGRELLYTADTGSGRYHLTARGLPGTDAVRLTSTTLDEEDPGFSADRTKLAFTREDTAGRWHVYRALADGTERRKVAGDVGDVPWTYRNPRWSPDNSRLAYACRPLTQAYWDLCVRNMSSGGVKKVPAVLANGGHWLANGNELVVVSATSPPTIQIVAYDNSYRIAIPGTAEARDVALSPDGSRIAWTRYEGWQGEPDTGGSIRSLRVSPLSGGRGIVLTGTGYANDPEFSADGATVYFTHGQRTAGVPLRRDVWSAKATGGGLVNVTSTPEVDEDNVTIRDAVTPPRQPQMARPLADFTGDGKAEIAVFRPGTGAWRIRGLPTVYWGRLGDIPVAADYNGDKKAERAVFRPSDGTWRIYGRRSVTWGRAGDVPVPADYNGDGKADIAVFRPSDGSWRIYGRTPVVFGKRGDVPVPSDFNGDRKADVAIYRPSSGTWAIRNRGVIDWYEGLPVPGDYLGRGRDQQAIFRDDDWLVGPVIGFATVPRTFHDVPAYGNFNGDRRIEPGVFNPTLGAWRIMGQRSVVWGIPGDIPV